MKTLWSNATVWWSEREIEEREALIRLCRSIVGDVWGGMNRAVRFVRVETPVLTPAMAVRGHIETGFNLLALDDKTMLRPETTAGCVAAFEAMYPMESQRRKQMPLCVWQAGKSYRTEANADTMRATKLRLAEFWQLEFELFTSADTKSDYIGSALAALTARFGGQAEAAADLPHYSRRTVDWMIGDLEVAGCSERTDWPEGVIHEVSIGLDRLVALSTVS